MTEIETTENGFAAFNLPRALASSLEHMKYTQPTPVQAQAIPAALKGKDVLGSAQTGTGKTGAFIIPVLARLMTDSHASALIMTPTRELAAQILTVARQMLHKNDSIKSALLIGGESIGRQRAQLAARPRLIIGTPGRINDHLRDRTNLFANTNMLVLDEADRMLDMGFTPQINNVIKHMTAPQRQTLLFSATFEASVIKLTQNYMKDPVRVTIEPERTSAATIVHETLNTTEKTRYEDLMNELYNRKGSIILFIKTKHGADRMASKLDGDGHSVDVIHGGLSQRQRDRAIASFRNKTTRIMVATDVAARGLDVPHIEHVINYDLPQVAEDYVHRIGRTGRNGAEGRALSFLMPSERGKWNAIQRILNPDAKPERGGARRGNTGGRNMGHTDREFEQGGEPRSIHPGPRRNTWGKKQRPQEERSERSAPRFDPRNDVATQQDPDIVAAVAEETERHERKQERRSEFKPKQSKPFKKFGERGSKPAFGERGPKPAFGERGPKPAFGERGPKRSFDKPFRKPEGERDFNRQDGEQSFQRLDGDKPFQKRERSFDRQDGERSFQRPEGEKPFRKREGGERSFNRQDGDKPFRKREDGERRFGRPDGDKPFQKREGGFQGRKPFEKDGNFKPRDRDGAERNFNTEGAGGEDRFRDDKPFGEKKKFFGKKPGGFKGNGGGYKGGQKSGGFKSGGFKSGGGFKGKRRAEG